MKHVLKHLVILTAVMALMIMTASIALAHPGDAAAGDETDTANQAAGEDPPAFSNSGKGNGGLWGNPATADSENGSFTSGTGQDAMWMQIVHNPLCSAHDDWHAGVFD